MDGSKETAKPRWRRVFELGADVAGAAAGGAAGTISGPPGVLAGAVTGVGVTRALRAAGDEVERRVMGPRQRVRIGLVYRLAAEGIQERLDSGERPREDGFFEEEADGISDAAELLEGVLLKAADEYERRKLPFMARLFVNTAFRADVDASHAHYLLRLADRLTYQQTCLLALLGTDDWREAFRQAERPHADARSERPNRALFAELDELGNQSLVGFAQKDGHVAHFAAVMDGGSFRGLSERIALMPAGRSLYDLMGLSDVPDDHLHALVERLAAGTG